MKPPLPHSYWVEPGRLLAGEHPGGGGESATRARLEALLDAGVCCFVDLTQPHELPSYRELLPAGVQYQNFPMRDHGLPESPQQMRDLQRALEQFMATGTVYLHCRAGIGRTGVAMGVYLREQGESPTGALAELNRLWQQNARSVSWPYVPETEEQSAYVRNWGAVQPAGHAERWRGCLLALAIGDALAHEKGTGTGPLNWTDDTGTTLCVAESLLARGGFDGRDQLERYRAWAQDPASSGAAASAALRPSVRHVLARAAWNRSPLTGSHDPAQMDPSPLPRAAAAALFAGTHFDAAAALAADCTRVTHQTMVLVDASRVLAAMISQSLAGRPRHVVLAGQVGGLPLCEEVSALIAGWSAVRTGRRKPLPGVLGVLDRAVRCVARSSTFGDGLQRALDSPGDDRDAVCAAYGALAGALYGERAIEAALLQRLAGRGRLSQLADRLWQHGSVRHGATA